MEFRHPATSRSAVQIVLLYVLCAAAWILFSDLVVSLLVQDPWLAGVVSLVKGWVFVAVTAALLYVLIQRRFSVLDESHRLREEAEQRRVAEVEERERRIRHVSRLYAVLSEANRAVVRRLDEGELLREVCRILVQTGGFSLAWFGRPDPSGRVLCEVSYGEAQGYMVVPEKFDFCLQETVD